GYFAAAMQTQIGSLRSSQDRLMQLSAQLDHSAHHDSLTGVANRQGLQRHLGALLDGQDEGAAEVRLVHIDLDKFKLINDTYGHPVGDSVLKQAAKMMTDEFGDQELVARLGGDEFVIVSKCASDPSHTDLQHRCDRLIARLRQPIFVNGIECRIGASIGYVVADASDCCIETLITNSDLALYAAKGDGGQCARRFDASMRAKLEEHRIFSVQVEEALAEDRICCVLQPQVCLQTGEVTGVEGLGRIRSHTGQLLVPAQILPVLTEMGRLPEFDFKVMQRSLDALISIRAAGLNMPHVSINASGESLRSLDYTATLCTELDRRGLRRDDIVVEILESTLIESVDDTAAKSIAALLEAGITTLMDDFGSGHATITNLLKLNLDGMKLDQSLVAIIENEKAQEVVKGVYGIAINLGLTVIAEGVETPQQFAILRDIGFETVQGFGICEPIEPAAFETWLRDYGKSHVRKLQADLHNYRNANIA
ncbi:MAG: EAL domain-containing protein, partial [Pseudomonadota bacterium]